MTMKIHSEKPVTLLDQSKPSQAKGGKDKPAEARNSQHDSVAISTFVEEVNQAKTSSSAEAPERAEKISALKQQVAAGTYQPDLEKVADSLLKYIMKDE